MKQEGSGVVPSDFLVNQKTQQFQGQVPPGVVTQNQEFSEEQLLNESLELHKEPQFITSNRRAEIDAEVSKAINRETLAQEKAQQEVETVTKKYENVPKVPRDILKDLLLRGEHRKTFEIFNHMWTLRALDQGDILLAMDDLKDNLETEAGRVTAVVFSKVVYSIEEIDNIPIYDFFPEIQPTKYSSKIEYVIAVKKALRAYLVGMPPIVIDTIYLKYSEVEDERDQAILKLKNS